MAGFARPFSRQNGNEPVAHSAIKAAPLDITTSRQPIGFTALPGIFALPIYQENLLPLS